MDRRGMPLEKFRVTQCGGPALRMADQDFPSSFPLLAFPHALLPTTGHVRRLLLHEKTCLRAAWWSSRLCLEQHPVL